MTGWETVRNEGDKATRLRVSIIFGRKRQRGQELAGRIQGQGLECHVFVSEVANIQMPDCSLYTKDSRTGTRP